MNENGKELRDFANELKLINTFFRKKEIYKYTWCGRWALSLIDYITVNDKLKAVVKDTTMSRSYSTDTDRYMVISKIQI